MSPIVRDVLVGNCRLIQGNCLDVMPVLGKVDAVVTDPPYKLSQAYSASVDADNLDAVSLIWPMAPLLLNATKPGGTAVVFYDTRILPLCLHAFRHGGWRYLRALTLYRRWGQASLVHGWMSTSDFALVFAAPGEKPAFRGEPRHDVYVKASPEADATGHPAQKPLEFVRHIVANVATPGETVLDPWMGSGTTGLACAQEGRAFIGIEQDPIYFDMALRRISEAGTEADLFTPSGAPPSQMALL